MKEKESNPDKAALCAAQVKQPQPQEVSASPGESVAVGPSVNEETDSTPGEWAEMETGKHDLQFACDWAVFPKDVPNSLCYCTSEERADWIRDRLNELRALRFPSPPSTASMQPTARRVSAEGEQPAQPAVPNIDTQPQLLHDQDRSMLDFWIRTNNAESKADRSWWEECWNAALFYARTVQAPKPSGDSQPLANEISPPAQNAHTSGLTNEDEERDAQ